MARQGAVRQANVQTTPDQAPATLREFIDPRQVFLLLLVFRWASLLRAVWLVWTGRGGPKTQLLQGGLLALAVLHTFLLTWFHRPLNSQLQRRPALLGVDILLTVGALLLATPESFEHLPEDQRTLLQSVTSQGAVSLGTTMLYIDRARRLAVEQERNRIARDIHDTVAQLRHSILDIWPSGLTLERFQDDLSEETVRTHVKHILNKLGLPNRVQAILMSVRKGDHRSSRRHGRRLNIIPAAHFDIGCL